MFRKTMNIEHIRQQDHFKPKPSYVTLNVTKKKTIHISIIFSSLHEKIICSHSVHVFFKHNPISSKYILLINLLVLLQSPEQSKLHMELSLQPQFHHELWFDLFCQVMVACCIIFHLGIFFLYI